jgi:predicted nuclease with TOPRIM domain
MLSNQLFNVYQEIQNTIGYFLKLVRLGKKEGLTPEQIIIFIQMADKIHDLKEKFQHLQSEVVDIGIRKSVGKEQLKDLHKGIEAAQEKVNSADRASKVKYEELSETCSQIQKLENYLEKLKGGQNYQELEAIVRNKVGEILADNKKLLQNALASVIVALRHDPDRYLLIDRMELTPFTTNTIINYNSFLSLRRPPYLHQGNEQFVSERC